MSVDISFSPLITPEDNLSGDTTLDDTGSDLLSECSKVWTAKHSATVNARVSSSKQLLKSITGKKSLEEINKEEPTVFMEVCNLFIRKYVTYTIAELIINILTTKLK